MNKQQILDVYNHIKQRAKDIGEFTEKYNIQTVRSFGILRWYDYFFVDMEEDLIVFYEEVYGESASEIEYPLSYFSEDNWMELIQNDHDEYAEKRKLQQQENEKNIKEREYKEFLRLSEKFTQTRI